MGKRQLKTKDNSTKKAKKAETLPSTQSDEVAAGDELDLAEVIAMGGSKVTISSDRLRYALLTYRKTLTG